MNIFKNQIVIASLIFLFLFPLNSLSNDKLMIYELSTSSTFGEVEKFIKKNNYQKNTFLTRSDEMDTISCFEDRNENEVKIEYSPRTKIVSKFYSEWYYQALKIDDDYYIESTNFYKGVIKYIQKKYGEITSVVITKYSSPNFHEVIIRDKGIIDDLDFSNYVVKWDYCNIEFNWVNDERIVSLIYFNEGGATTRSRIRYIFVNNYNQKKRKSEIESINNDKIVSQFVTYFIVIAIIATIAFLIIRNKKKNNKEISDETINRSEGTHGDKNNKSNLPESYEQFDNHPGKSVSLLNDDPNWNKFIQYESENEEELVARFRRKEFENYILNAAYKKGISYSRATENSSGYELKITVNEVITTYFRWANKNEPIMCINATILNTNLRPGLNRCVFEYKYIVRAPFAGHLDSSSFYQERENDGGRMYQIYTAQRAKELWPKMPSDFIYDDLEKLSRVCVNFNEYCYDEHFSDSFPFWDWEAEGKDPCLLYEWKVKNFAEVTKGQHVCSIIKNPYKYRREYKIYSPVSGIITWGINGEKTEYRYQNEMHLSDLFTIYKNKYFLISWRYLMGFEETKEVDRFDGTVSLSWEKVAGRTLPLGENEYIEEGYRGFEMVSDIGQNVIVSLRVKNNIPYIVFSFNSKTIRLSSGDYVDLLFEDFSGKTFVLTFAITRNFIEEAFKDIYDVSFFCELSQNNIVCMKENNCVSWRVRFSKQPLMSVVGYNESIWCPKEYACEVFKAYVVKFSDLIEELKEDYPIEFTSPKETTVVSMIDETCYVYLMYDTSNGYYKIGISNNPEYRERTLQSEKPTIVKICAKGYPNRTIASAIESALHKSYESKRLRGEWFALNDDDVTAIAATLS